MSFIVTNGDIFKLEYDAIVIPTQPSLKLQGNLGGQFLHYCGDKINVELSQYKSISFGEAIIVNAYNLPCKRAILVCNPDYKEKNDYEENLLAKSYTNALELADIFELHSIAFPLLSVGRYHFPIRKALEIAISSIKEYLDTNPDLDLNVALVIYDNEYFKTYKDIFSTLDVHKIRRLKEIDDESKFHLNEEYLYWYTRSVPRLIGKYSDNKSLTLSELIDIFCATYDITKTECYTGVMSKTSFNEMLKNNKATKNTLISLGINMGLHPEDFIKFLATIGESFNAQSIRDQIIIKYLPYQDEYSPYKLIKMINKELISLGLEPLRTN